MCFCCPLWGQHFHRQRTEKNCPAPWSSQHWGWRIPAATALLIANTGMQVLWAAIQGCLMALSETRCRPCAARGVQGLKQMLTCTSLNAGRCCFRCHRSTHLLLTATEAGPQRETRGPPQPNPPDPTALPEPESRDLASLGQYFTAGGSRLPEARMAKQKL